MAVESHQIEQYIKTALGADVTVTPWRGAEHLPQFLRAMYSFAQIRLLGMSGLLVLDSGHAERSPATVRKHLDLLRAKQDTEVIYVRDQVTAYNRKRLIEQKVPFIVPGNQMYLPMLGIDLREHFRRLRSENPVFSPSTQAVVIQVLLHGADGDLVPLAAARCLGYSAMTMTRAFDELEAAELGTVTICGRERRLRFIADRKSLWTKVQPFLRNPVTKTLYVQRTEATTSGIRAGLTALAQYSMLSPPEYVTHALSREEWNLLRQQHRITELPGPEADSEELEVWAYPPKLFAERGVVDPLSLYLSLKDNNDERTQTALDEMMRKLGW
ncbi:MAG TPA: hypothetical protein VGP72_00645 [Planctomycetota bacterium]